MPKGPKGEKRPGDVIGLAVKVGGLPPARKRMRQKNTPRTRRRRKWAAKGARRGRSA